MHFTSVKLRTFIHLWCDIIYFYVSLSRAVHGLLAEPGIVLHPARSLSIPAVSCFRFFRRYLLLPPQGHEDLEHAGRGGRAPLPGAP